MTNPTYPGLTDEQITSFMTNGFLRLTNCFTAEQAAEYTSNVWTRLGFSPHDQKSWTRERTNMPRHREFPVSSFAPKAWAAICSLVGGEDKVTEASKNWSDALIVNLGSEEFEGKVGGEGTRPKELQGWHVDGDFFVHFLDSPEQGLLVIPLFTDVEEDGGETVVCPDGMAKIARYLYDHPEGVYPRMSPMTNPTQYESNLTFYNTLIQSCTTFHGMTGKLGDVILMHPLMLHTASRNPKRLVRIITNPPVSLKEPFNFDREGGKYSSVERKTLQLLGKERLDGWRIKGERREVVPERVRLQKKMLEDERERLKGGSAEVTVHEIKPEHAFEGQFYE